MEKILKQFNNLKIIVFGDIILDEYVYGKVERISPEAPVPILHYGRQEYRLGGAANVALNLAALGIQSALAGIIDCSAKSNTLLQLLQKKNIDTQFIIQSKQCILPVKTRFVSADHQLLRMDKEDVHPIAMDLLTPLFDKLHKGLKHYQALILSDYAKGIIHVESYKALQTLIQNNNTYFAIDPKKSNFNIYTDCDLMTPNHIEAKDDIGLPFESDSEVMQNASRILEKHALKELLITRGNKGMALFCNDDTPILLPTKAKSVYDVSGAGDTVIATYTAARCAMANPKTAALIANTCAGIVVSKFGTSTATQAELLHVLKEEA